MLRFVFAGSVVLFGLGWWGLRAEQTALGRASDQHPYRRREAWA